jgi:hypothetical protein
MAKDAIQSVGNISKRVGLASVGCAARTRNNGYP